jgi:formyl-CoA transferase
MYAAADGEFFMGVGTDRMFERLCTKVERKDLLHDPRYEANDGRVLHRAELDAELEPVFRTRDRRHWVDLCLGLDIPASEVFTIADVAEQEQALAREMIVDTGVDSVRSAGIPIKLSRSPGAVRRPPPHAGADNARLLGSPPGGAGAAPPGSG